ncbi:hypothetical protein HPS26_11615 [Klebsiella aerogenes]|uniref:hypothetical protein n=1 Tax=Klebsiella aerogenes TaxID=548 RepID=UPI0014953C83|nr:hypothetical protein [Klebsiella aerogenes]MDX7186329.1 hypothetical protein [Klebsiella aerogenes]NPD50674.1 hypothetical protein [Klebsiella aerogenes]NPD77847.1 hypothetical protein [Klebsiella aerogenes]HCT6902149.1 hypothetical protein [Klebsiella aerogenes]
MAATPYPAYGTDAICRPSKRSATGQGVVDAVVGPVSVAPPGRVRVDAVCRPGKRSATGQGAG